MGLGMTGRQRHSAPGLGGSGVEVSGIGALWFHLECHEWSAADTCIELRVAACMPFPFPTEAATTDWACPDANLSKEDDRHANVHLHPYVAVHRKDLLVPC